MIYSNSGKGEILSLGQDAISHEVMTGTEVTKLLGISLDTLHILRSKHALPFHRLGAGTIRYRRSEILDWLSQQPSKRSKAGRQKRGE